MAGASRADYIKALTAKFIELVESLEPGERLSITKISAAQGRPRAKSKSAAKKKAKAKKAG